MAADQPPAATVPAAGTQAAPVAKTADDQRPPPVVVRCWLNTAPFWKNRLGEGWVGKKMLGSGGFGTVSISPLASHLTQLQKAQLIPSATTSRPPANQFIHTFQV